MKYKLKAFFWPFIMMSIYFYMPYILNRNYGMICESNEGCPRIQLINFSNILDPQIIAKILFFMFEIIPVIILLLTIISLFLGIKFLIIKNKYKNTGNQYHFEKLQKATTAIKKHTLIFLVFFIVVSIPRLLFSLSKDNPRISPACEIVGYTKEGYPIFCE
jgi:hypothetical protein